MEKEKSKITVRQLYDHIIKNMSAEDALLKLLEANILNYEKLKFENGKEVHPIFIMTMAAIDMGWQFAVETNQPHVRGMVSGTQEYMDSIYKKKEEKPSGRQSNEETNEKTF